MSDIDTENQTWHIIKAMLSQNSIILILLGKAKLRTAIQLSLNNYHKAAIPIHLQETIEFFPPHMTHHLFIIAEHFLGKIIKQNKKINGLGTS